MNKTATLIIGILVSIVAIDLNAQQLPQSGAELNIVENNIELKAGESKNIEVTRVRARAYSKTKFGGIKVNNVDGIAVVINQNEVNKDSFVLAIEAGENVPNGKYTLTIQGDGKYATKVKGTMLSVTIVGKDNLAKSE
ncbi:MAG: hypothetical protein RJQ09_09510 [Cyclobacteriaceae bacterium]